MPNQLTDIQKAEPSGLILGIDASNLSRGGGVTHLVELLRAAEPAKHGFSKVVVWSSAKTLSVLEKKDWLEKENPPTMEKGLLHRVLWQRFSLSKQAEARGCDVLFVPGGNFVGTFRPVVTLSQNLLPFEMKELLRYRFARLTAKYLLLRWTQSRSFRASDGVIFLTEYARRAVTTVTGKVKGKLVIIPHGLNPRFHSAPKPQRTIAEYDDSAPFRLLYVSIIDQYKHQWHVIEAVAALRKEHQLPLSLSLVGPFYPPSLKRLKESVAKHDPTGQWVNYRGAIPYDALHHEYMHADLGIFASTCENMPIILLEKIAAGLPVACSDCGPMPEMLGDSGMFFDAVNPYDIAQKLLEAVMSPSLRERNAIANHKTSLLFSWQKCANDTFAFLREIAVQHSAAKQSPP